jgi:hypothetical protein
LALQHRPAAAYATARDEHLLLVHLRLQQGVVSDELVVGRDLGIRAEGALTAHGYFGMFIHDTGERNFSMDGDILLDVGARARIGADDSRTRASVRVAARGGVGIMDIRDVTTLGPALHHVSVDAQVLSEFASTSAGALYLVAGSTVVLDELGVRARGEVGVGSPVVSGMIDLEGRLMDGMLQVQDGSERRVGATVVVQPGPQVRLRLRGVTSFDQPDGVSLMGTLEVIDPLR